MIRRQFLRFGGAAGILALTRPRPAEGATPAATAAAPRQAQAGAANVPAFELEEATVASLRDAMTSGRLTARAIAEKYLERIEAVDRRGPAINSILALNPDALDIADQLDRERKEKGPRGPLHGIPVLLKDNIDTADKMKTTAGSLALADNAASADAFLVTRLRAAGAVILGKTNLSEWANFRSDRSTSGWSAVGGLTRNPYALDRNGCGSSTGSGVAIAANLAALAVGTETDGSIVCPSGINGIVGIKPTVGLIGRSGIIPISASQDTAGPMARTVADAAVMLGVMTGADPRDGATKASDGKAVADYTKFLDPAGLKGARIGVPRNAFRLRDHVEPVFKAAIDALKDAGAIIIDPAEIPTSGKFGDAEDDVLHYEFKDGVNAYLAAANPAVKARTLAALIAFNNDNKDRELRWFGQETFIKAEKLGPLTSPAYRKARRACITLTRTQGIDAIMTKHKLDAFVALTNGPSWAIDVVNGDRFTGGSSSIPAVSGYPNITVPMGFVYGLPVGLSFFGRAWSEPVLIKLAYAFEQTTKARKPPAFKPTVD
jgi:amidase